MNIQEKESGTEIIDSKLEYYLKRYINIHYKEYPNSYEIGEWIINDFLTKLFNTKIPNKERAIIAIKHTMRDMNVSAFVKMNKGD